MASTGKDAEVNDQNRSTRLCQDARLGRDGLAERGDVMSRFMMLNGCLFAMYGLWADITTESSTMIGTYACFFILLAIYEKVDGLPKFVIKKGQR